MMKGLRDRRTTELGLKERITDIESEDILPTDGARGVDSCKPLDRRGARRPDGRREGTKIFPPKIARNPLISLNSDERIQGNPSFSNP
jgi:hypothetical protein